MAIATGTALAIAAGASAAGGSIYSAKKQSKAAKDASAVEKQAADAALAFEREREARRQKEYDEERARSWRLVDEDRQIAADKRAMWRERTRPYAELGGASAASILDLMRPHPEINLHVQPGGVAGPPLSGGQAAPTLAALAAMRPPPMPMDEIPRPNA